MSIVALSGNDTVTINNTVLTCGADKNIAELKFPNEMMSVKVGKNGNTIYAQNETGKVAELTLRVLRGSFDDGFLNNLLITQDANPPGFPLMIGQFIKNIGDGQGNIIQDVYILSGGCFYKRVESIQNTEGETDQAVSVYMLKFSNAPRAIT